MAESGAVWRNWSGLQQSAPARWWRPGGEGELVALLQGSTGEVRVTGAGIRSVRCVRPLRTLLSLTS